MMEAVRRIQFCCGHRVFNHESKCANMHGHNYVLFAHARPNGSLDEIGRVIDFSEIKKRLAGWIDDNWDHGFVYYESDFQVVRALDKVEGQKIYPMKTNPTPENMAAHILNEICPALFADTDIEICKIVLWETENCFVEVKK